MPIVYAFSHKSWYSTAIFFFKNIAAQAHIHIVTIYL